MPGIDMISMVVYKSMDDAALSKLCEVFNEIITSGKPAVLNKVNDLKAAFPSNIPVTAQFLLAKNFSAINSRWNYSR